MTDHRLRSKAKTIHRGFRKTARADARTSLWHQIRQTHIGYANIAAAVVFSLIVLWVTISNNTDSSINQCISSSSAIQNIDVSTLSIHDQNELMRTARMMRKKCEKNVGMVWTVRQKIVPFLNSSDKNIAKQARDIIKSYGLEPPVRPSVTQKAPISPPRIEPAPTAGAQGLVRPKTIPPPRFLSMNYPFRIEMPTQNLTDEANAISRTMKNWVIVGRPPGQIPLTPEPPKLTIEKVSSPELRCFDSSMCELAPQVVERIKRELGIDVHVKELIPESGVGDMATYHRLELVLPARRLTFKPGVVLPSGACPECYGY